jgi:hypothetical protein
VRRVVSSYSNAEAFNFNAQVFGKNRKEIVIESRNYCCLILQGGGDFKQIFQLSRREQ